MTIAESLERDSVAEMLEQADDDGQLVPGSNGWQQRQSELVEGYLTTRDATQTTPLARIHAARGRAWLERATDNEQRALLEAATPTNGELPTPADAEAAVEPLSWLLGRLADGVKLTQTGALPRVLVREAVERYPDWWDSDLFGPPHREAEIYPLEVLHALVDELGFARPRRGLLRLGPRGRALRTDPLGLLAAIASMIATGGSLQLDLALAHLLTGHEPELDFRLVHLLGPFHGVTRRPTPTRGGGDSRRTNARRRDPSRARLRASTQPGPTSHRPATLVCYAAETREGHCGRHRKARALSSRGGCRSARAARP